MTITSKKMPDPPKQRGGGFGSHGGRNAVKHLGALRGPGVLVLDGRQRPVTYEIDVYEGRNQKSGAGALNGVFEVPDEEDEGGTPAVLKLKDGAEVAIVILGGDETGVDIETRGDIPGF